MCPQRDFFPCQMVLLTALIIDVKAGLTPGRSKYLMQTHEQLKKGNIFYLWARFVFCLSNQFDVYWLKSQVCHCALKTLNKLFQSGQGIVAKIILIYFSHIICCYCPNFLVLLLNFYFNLEMPTTATQLTLNNHLSPQ